MSDAARDWKRMVLQYSLQQHLKHSEDDRPAEVSKAVLHWLAGADVPLDEHAEYVAFGGMYYTWLTLLENATLEHDAGTVASPRNVSRQLFLTQLIDFLRDQGRAYLEAEHHVERYNASLRQPSSLDTAGID